MKSRISNSNNNCDNMTMGLVSSFLAMILLFITTPAASFTSVSEVRSSTSRGYPISIPVVLTATADNNNIVTDAVPISRRSLLGKTSMLPFLLLGETIFNNPVSAAETPDDAPKARPTVHESLYYVLRVREATDQETRLITTGRFKDQQRANVKLAVKFMVSNYRLSDNIIRSSAFIVDNTKRTKASVAGQAAVQNLFTILEYFDSADVQNIKVGSNAIAGKEKIVLSGLAATRDNIDEFLSYFESSDVQLVQNRIRTENELNVKEYDANLGTILNLK